ncbi:SulP family inorganic anion transporter, partial [Akkermansiaceae bacterium]|nr:SulP family inorganic anion transporter [Akkermansiaceae bacterium]
MDKVMRQVRLAYRAFGKWAASNQLRLFPFRDNFSDYTSLDGKADLRAAINIALLAIPQGMAYAAIAELPILYGIVCSAIAAIVAPLFASSKHTILGPTNATSLMVFSFFAAGTYSTAEKLNLMPLLVLMVGIICLIGAILKAAELIQYVSQSVLVGYITGAAILIIINQCKHLFGVSEVVIPASNFFGMLSELIATKKAYLWQPAVLGFSTLAFYLAMSRWLKALPNFAISLALASIISTLIGSQSPVWNAAVPTFSSFSLNDLTLRLPEPTSAGLFADISNLLGVAVAIAFLATLENTVMAKSLASRTGSRTEINQDMMSVGMSNLACAFTAAMPSSGSLTRSALNYESDARSGISSILAG